MTKIRIGIIGCGTIGLEIAKACVGELSDRVQLAGVCDEDDKKISNLRKALGKKVASLRMDDLIKRVDLVIESASARVSVEVVKKCIRAKRDCFVMSVGGLLGREDIFKEAEKKKVAIYLPSGAICGIDGLKSASWGRIDSVSLITRKPPRGLEGAPYLVERGVDLKNLTGETVVFDGTAGEAVKGFPQNVNVSAVLSLAGIGSKKTRVKIVTSPDYTKNIHEIEVSGEFGNIKTRTENIPSRSNPKTSSLAIFSAIATLKGITGSVKIGT